MAPVPGGLRLGDVEVALDPKARRLTWHGAPVERGTRANAVRISLGAFHVDVHPALGNQLHYGVADKLLRVMSLDELGLDGEELDATGLSIDELLDR